MSNRGLPCSSALFYLLLLLRLSRTGMAIRGTRIGAVFCSIFAQRFSGTGIGMEDRHRGWTIRNEPSPVCLSFYCMRVCSSSLVFYKLR